MDVLRDNADLFRDAFLTSVWLTVAAGVLGMGLGMILAAARVAPVRIARAVATSYVQVMRSSPVPVVFFFAIFVLPELGVTASFFELAVLSLALYHAAHFCEAIRSGINTVPVGQIEAARSIGFGFQRTFIAVILPQALRVSVPILINVLILLIRNSAVAGAFAVDDLFAIMLRVANSEPQAVLFVLAVTGLLYLAITVPAGVLASNIERRVAFLR